jgi:hypothetical protein
MKKIMSAKSNDGLGQHRGIELDASRLKQVQGGSKLFEQVPPGAGPARGSDPWP